MSVHQLRRRTAAAGAAVAGPVVLLVLPKCPLCVLPLMVAAGVSLPPGRFLDLVVIGVTAAWLTGLLVVSRSSLLTGLAALAVPVLLSGRLLANDLATWGGVTLMLVVSAMTWFSGRSCTGACRAAAHSSTSEEEMPCPPTNAP